MSRDIRIMRLVDENDPQRGINITASYRMGGYNYFTGKDTRRGYAYDFSPTTQCGYGETYQAFSGGYVMVEDAKRFSQKKMNELVNNFKLEDWEAAIASIAMKNNIKLTYPLVD